MANFLRIKKFKAYVQIYSSCVPVRYEWQLRTDFLSLENNYSRKLSENSSKKMCRKKNMDT
jgi:hypothetical protein